MKKRVSKISILILAIALMMPLILFKGEVVKADTKKDISVKTKVGFNDKYKVGYFTPVTISIKNDYKDIQGTVEVKVPTSENKYDSYMKNLSIQKGTEKVVTINVPVKQAFLKYEISIKDGSEEVYSEEIKVGSANNQTVKFVGILSDDFDSLTYLNKFPAPKGVTVSTELIKLDEKEFPDYLRVLQSFDVIIINNFDSSKLSKEAYESLKSWVKLGGTLLVGTGTNYNKTLSIFKDDFIKGKPGEIINVNTSKIYNVATNGDNNNSVSVENLNIQIDGSSTNIQEGNTKLLQTLKIGSGYVAIAGFDFGLKPFVGWANNSAFGEKIFGMINPNFVVSDKFDNSYRNGYFSVSGLVSSLMDKKANINIYLAVLIIYIVLVAPITYFILKKLDKRELMWITVPCMAIVFGVVIYFLGSGTRLSEVVTNNANIISLDSKGVATKNTYVGIFTPKKMNVEVSSKEGKRLESLDNPNYNGDAENAKRNEVDTVIREDKGSLEFKNKSVLASRTLSIPSTTINLGKIESNISLDGDNIKGSIKNSTLYDFEYCYVITPKTYYILGPVKKGQSVNVDKKSGDYVGDVNQLTYDKKIYNLNTANASEEDRFNADLLRMSYSQSMQPTRVKDISVVAITKDTISKPLIVNGKDSVVKDRTIIRMPIVLNFRSGDTMQYPQGFVEHRILNASNVNYDPYGDVFYNTGTPEIIYNIDKNIIVSELKLYLESINGKVGSYNATLEIYDYKQDKYVSKTGDSFNSDEIKKYLNGDNELKIKLTIGNNGEPVQVPEISVKGKVK
ncbi:hypothetical protein JHL18_14325 [Clostridium sp. YIM B02505]|uniref:Membrane-associated protein n=1 Tax=Clostridium yunnanense TaxID=2800325 RepID=A0ABS1EQY6_9CLOT|nr:hypothetical protein [Clostridium yunnanense]MBK1811794.1 hypothetical protein [Clostridium yunnanense]